MNTIVRKVNQTNLNKDIIKEAASIIRKGGLVAFPTETVYGLGANGLDEEASKRIYQAKGRPSDNPLILHISDLESLLNLTADIPESAKKLYKAFWPGPLTMIFKKSDIVPYSTTGGLDTVAVRMPQDGIALALIDDAGCPIAAPSANTSGRPSPTMAEHVMQDLSGRIDMVLDGGAVGIGLESTIIDVSVDKPVILRPGYITKAMLEGVIGSVDVDPTIAELQDKTSDPPKAPGMKYKHYAPKGELLIVEGSDNLVAKEINCRAQQNLDKGFRVGIIAAMESQNNYQYGIVKNIGSRYDEDTIARNLYKVLRDFDKMNIDYIYTESFHSKNLGHAIMNRLLKAAGHHLIKV